MSEGKCGKVRGEVHVGVREGKEGGEWEGKKKERGEEAQEIYGGHSTWCIDVHGYYMYVE